MMHPRKEDCSMIKLTSLQQSTLFNFLNKESSNVNRCAMISILRLILISVYKKINETDSASIFP